MGDRTKAQQIEAMRSASRRRHLRRLGWKRDGDRWRLGVHAISDCIVDTTPRVVRELAKALAEYEAR